jgi:hypothetical protein
LVYIIKLAALLNAMQPYRFFVFILFVLALSACKQEQTPEPSGDYVQYFNGAIDGKKVDIKTATTVSYHPCENCNVESVSGDWTGYGSINKDAYVVSVFLAKDKPNDAQMPKLKFRVFDIKPGDFKITGEEDIYNPLASYILIIKKEKAGEDNKLYAPNPQKHPFEIAINKYEFKPDSGLPFVGGKLNGVLYNTKNQQDSIVLKDCNFEVRY